MVVAWFRVKDADSIGAPTMGLMRVPVAALVQGQVFEDWFPLIDTVMKPLKHGAAIRATISFRYCPGFAGFPGVVHTLRPSSSLCGSLCK